MKKLRLLTAIILSLLVVFMIMSCEKDDPIVVDPPVVEVPTHTLVAKVVGVGGTITPTYTEADSGSTVSLTIHPEAGYDLDSLFVNDIDVTNDIDKSSSSSFYDVNLDSDTTYVDVVFKKNLNWYLMDGKWRLNSYKVLWSDGIWYNHQVYGVPDVSPQVTLKFLSNGNREIYWDNDTIPNIAPWLVDETTNPPTMKMDEPLNLAVVYTIEKLDSANLTLVYEVEDWDNDTITYTHKDYYFKEK